MNKMHFFFCSLLISFKINNQSLRIIDWSHFIVFGNSFEFCKDKKFPDFLLTFSFFPRFASPVRTQGRHLTDLDIFIRQVSHVQLLTLTNHANLNLISPANQKCLFILPTEGAAIHLSTQATNTVHAQIYGQYYSTCTNIWSILQYMHKYMVNITVHAQIYGQYYSI